MRKLKFIILSTMIILLSGCGWSDAQEKYGDLLKQNITCTYYTEEKNSNSDYANIGSIDLSANYSGIYVAINNGSKQLLYGEDGGNTQVNTGKTYVYFNNNFLKSYLESYLEKKSCPQTIYLSRTNLYFQTNDCEGMDYYCDAYKLKISNVTNSEGKEVSCHHSDIIDCQKYIKNADQVGTTYYIELGLYKSNGTTKKYFGVSTDSSFKNIIIDDDESDGFKRYVNSNWFEITDEAISELWLPGNKFIDKDSLVIKADPSATSPTYFITGPNSTNYGTTDSGTIEDAPLIDPDVSNNGATLHDLKIEEIKFCDSGGVLKAFQVLGYILYIVKLIIPLLIVILGSVDFAKAVMSGDDKASRTAVMSLARRFIIAVIIFFIPTILDFLLGLVDETSEMFNDSGVTKCTDCLLDPLDNSCQAKNIGEK